MNVEKVGSKIIFAFYFEGRTIHENWREKENKRKLEGDENWKHDQ